MRCTRKLAKAITLWFTGLTVKHETEADYLADRFEDIYELILAHVVGDISDWRGGMS
jgi:hypothetical protein